MNTVNILKTRSGKILQEVSFALENNYHLRHYNNPETPMHLNALFNQLLLCVKYQNIIQITKYADKISRMRYKSNFDLYEIQTIVNLLQEVIWKNLCQVLPQNEVSSNLALISSILGAFKDAIACSYVEMANGKKIETYDVESLFHGTDSIFDFNSSL